MNLKKIGKEMNEIRCIWVTLGICFKQATFGNITLGELAVEWKKHNAKLIKHQKRLNVLLTASKSDNRRLR